MLQPIGCRLDRPRQYGGMSKESTMNPSALGGAPVSTTSPASTSEAGEKAPAYFWLWVMCLLGLDYFSTLAYQPSITYEVAGRLGPVATALVVLLTLGGALPVYWYMAGRSTQGQGSVGLLVRLVRGWWGKTLMVVLLGFAATDFIMLKTLSLADAAVHVIQNEYTPWQQVLADLAQWCRETSVPHLGQELSGFVTEQLAVTLILSALGFIFWFVLRNGFNRNVLVLAVPLIGLYLLLNGLLVGLGIAHLLQAPDILGRWYEQVQPVDLGSSAPWWDLGGWTMLGLMCLLFLPDLSLGLSGFEMSMIIMPQVQGRPEEEGSRPRSRIRNTRKVLVLAALVMAVYLLGSVLVTCLLIPAEELRPGGRAVNRALAYLAHGGRLGDTGAALHPWCGVLFGSLYDLNTVLVLALAGTSVMTALAVLLPRFLLRFGMELKWTHRWGVLLILFALINLAVTLWFRASVEAQRGAYATGVLVLISCTGLVTVLDLRQRRAQPQEKKKPWRLTVGFFALVTAVFVLLTGVVLVRSPAGLLIAAGFTAVILAMSVFSRFVRADELRTLGFQFQDAHAKFLWDSLRLADFPVLVPHRPGRYERELKEKEIRRDHNLDPEVDIAFLEVEVDDPSNFLQKLLIEVFQEDHRFVIKATRCVSVAHAIAAIALEMSKESKPPSLHFGWSELDLMTASWSYFAFGEGNIPWKVRELIHRAEPIPQRRPRVIIG